MAASNKGRLNALIAPPGKRRERAMPVRLTRNGQNSPDGPRAKGTNQDLGEMNLQLVANEENQDRAQCGKNEASGVISLVSRAKNDVGNAAAEKRSDDTEHDCPGHRQMHMHHRFCDNPRDKPDDDIPDYVKHTFSSMVCLQLKSPESAPIPSNCTAAEGIATPTFAAGKPGDSASS
jgi:hypothetical protein